MQLLSITEQSHNKITEIFGKSKKSIDEDVEIVKKWIQTQPHFPELMEDAKIRNFLIINKFSIEKTKQKIDSYYTIRGLIPDIFEKSNPKSRIMQEFMELTCCSIHPKSVEDVYRVYFLKPKILNSAMVREIGLQCYNISEVRLYEDVMVGDIIVYDMANVSLGDLTKITPTLLAKLLMVYKVFSMRVKSVYIINSPSYVTQLTSVLKSVVKPKIIDRVKICSNHTILSEIFPNIEDLPKDYGGAGPSLEDLNELTKLTLAQYQARFDKLDKLKVDENLRPEKLNNDELLGFHGNFKKLDVD